VKKMLGMVCEISSWAVFSKELPFWRMNQRERGIFLVLVFWLFVVVVIILGGCLDDSCGLCCYAGGDDMAVKCV